MHNFSISGIDGCGKSTSMSNVIDALSKEYLIATIGRPTYIAGQEIPEGKRYLFTNSTNTIDKLHTFNDNLEFRYGVAFTNILDGIRLSYINKKVLSGYNPDIIIYGRDRILDPAVYSTVYFPSTKKLSIESRINLAKAITGFEPADTIIYLNIDPDIALERIEKRIENEKAQTGLKRKKWKHMHENLRDLTILKQYYAETLDYLYHHSTSDIKIIDVNSTSLKQVSTNIEQIIREKIHLEQP
jgi:thymidylate kinase